MRLIPAIDILEGRCVRLHQGRFTCRTDYPEDPVERALTLEQQGFRYLHLVDLDGARRGRVEHLHLLAEITRSTSLKVDFGGGLYNTGDLEAALEAGASQVNLGSRAVQQPEQLARWIERFGPERLIVSADLQGTELRVRGWQEASGRHWPEFFRRLEDMGLLYLCVTDIARDGTLQGCNLPLYGRIREQFPRFRLIASGGIHALSELNALRSLGIEGAIIGKALLEGHLTPAQLQHWMEQTEEASGSC